MLNYPPAAAASHTWSSNTPPIVANGDTITISTGAEAAYSSPLVIPASATVTIVDGKCIDGTAVESFSINLTKETLSIPASFKPAAYSINGGATWVAVKTSYSFGANPLGDGFASLFNKDLTLQLTDKVNASNPNKGKPSSDAIIVAFPRINKRPAAPKVTINYSIGGDIEKTGEWVLVSAEKGADITKSVKAGIQVGATEKAGSKTVLDSHGYGQFYAGEKNGIPLREISKNAKGNPAAVKTRYYVRTAPSYDENTSTYTAASKPKAITASSERAPTKYKINYKTETITLKKGDAYAFGDVDYVTVTEKSKVFVISECITNETTIYIKKTATAKAPATAVQAIDPQTRAVLSTDGVTVTDGKITLDKKYEVKNPATGKWGGVPKTTVTTSFDIRLKTTARRVKNEWIGSASSPIGTLTITWGTTMDSKGKDIKRIVSATITPPDPDSGLEIFSMLDEELLFAYAPDDVQETPNDYLEPFGAELEVFEPDTAEYEEPEYDPGDEGEPAA